MPSILKPRTLGDREIVEVFHLELVRILAAGSQKARYAIKGGCNLRFFFGSVRYSEDIDFDIDITAATTLGKHLDATLRSQPLERLLRMHDIALVSWSKPKQTETTQRWKVTLGSANRAVQLHTKIEFSPRTNDDVATVDTVDDAVVAGYGVPRFAARHYPAAVAVRQKIGALAGRREVQARDVFDLDLLISRHRDAELGDVAALAGRAVERAMELGYDQYVSQVVAYLMPEHAALYESRTEWEAMQLRVVEFLEARRT